MENQADQNKIDLIDDDACLDLLPVKSLKKGDSRCLHHSKASKSSFVLEIVVR